LPFCLTVAPSFCGFASGFTVGGATVNDATENSVLSPVATTLSS